MKKFKRSYQDQESWHARCQARLGSKYDKGNYPSVDDVEKNLNIHHSMDAFGDFSKSGGAFLDPETLATLKKQQKRLNSNYSGELKRKWMRFPPS